MLIGIHLAHLAKVFHIRGTTVYRNSIIENEHTANIESDENQNHIVDIINSMLIIS